MDNYVDKVKGCFNSPSHKRISGVALNIPLLAKLLLQWVKLSTSYPQVIHRLSTMDFFADYLTRRELSALNIEVIHNESIAYYYYSYFIYIFILI